MPSTYQPGAGGKGAGAAGAAGAGAAPAPVENAEGAAPSNAVPSLPKKTKQKAPRRKLTVRPPSLSRHPVCSPRPQVLELTSPLGLGHVYATFQQQLRSCARGKGHEAGDLNRLLELYRAWHRRLFPDLPFEVFCEKLEQLGSTRPVQSCLRAMRGREVHGERFGEDVDALLQREEEEDTAGFGDAAARANAGGFGAAGGAGAAAPVAPPPRPQTEEDRLIEMGLDQDDEDEDEYY